mmetsp:Transcript_77850/g.166926  ORF Transcript_77850/g.166926 Transcript_77850/m.166926 type:complete len:362 (-) Transcript_77850:78-1163(-)
MYGRLLAASLADIPDTHAVVNTARREQRLAAAARTLPLEVLDCGTVPLESARCGHIPATHDRLPKEDPAVVPTGEDAAGIVRAEVEGEALLSVRLASVNGLGVGEGLLARPVESLALAVEIPHVDLASVGPRGHYAAGLRHRSDPVHTSWVRHRFGLQERFVLIVALLIAALVIFLLCAVLGGAVQVRPLHNVDAVVCLSLRLSPCDHVGCHGVACALRAQVVAHDVEAEAWPLHLGLVEHVVSARLYIELLALLDLVDAGSPDPFGPVVTIALLVILRLVILVLLLADLLFLLLLVTLVVILFLRLKPGVLGPSGCGASGGHLSLLRRRRSRCRLLFGCAAGASFAGVSSDTSPPPPVRH